MVDRFPGILPFPAASAQQEFAELGFVGEVGEGQHGVVLLEGGLAAGDHGGSPGPLIRSWGV